MCAYKRISPQPVIEGGTGATTLTAHGVLLGEGTSAITPTAVGTNGQLLIGTSAADPTWVTPTVGTGLSLTTNATTLSYALTTPVTVSNGGTGATSLTAHDVLVGNGTSAITLVAPSATSGIPLVSNGAAADPSFTTAVVAGGGTGLTSATAYAVLCGGTTSTAALQSIASVGTSGQVLTSNGAGALPTFQAAGGALSTASVTLTSAQVKALHATPITLVAAPGAGKAILVFTSIAQLNYGGTNAFVNSGGFPINIFYGNGTTSGITGAGLLANTQITATSNQFAQGYSQNNSASSVALNAAVVVSQGSATEITGNAAGDNTIDVQIWYLTVTP